MELRAPRFTPEGEELFGEMARIFVSKPEANIIKLQFQGDSRGLPQVRFVPKQGAQNIIPMPTPMETGLPGRALVSAISASVMVCDFVTLGLIEIQLAIRESVVGDPEVKAEVDAVLGAIVSTELALELALALDVERKAMKPKPAKRYTIHGYSRNGAANKPR